LSRYFIFNYSVYIICCIYNRL